jgi:hypothetical protein
MWIKKVQFGQQLGFEPRAWERWPLQVRVDVRDDSGRYRPVSRQGGPTMDREDLRALAQDTLTEIRVRDRSLDNTGPLAKLIYFDDSEILMVRYAAVQQYSSISIDQKDFVFQFPIRDFTGRNIYPKETAKGFVELFYDEIKDIICNPKRQTEAGKLSRYKLGPTCAGLSAFITQQFGLNEPIAIGVGAYLLIVLLESTRGAFCKMVKPEVRDRLQNS